MASRWVDSGIDWANLNLHKERTSWVIDELYRAFKEREQMLLYYTDQIGSIPAWDLDANTRDENKLDEIMIGLQTWLNSLTNNYSRFLDTTIDPNGQTITTGFLNGLPYFDSAALGTLETLVGVSLAQIRTWDVTAQRIDSDLLQMIYLVLAELNEIITIERANPFQPPNPANNPWDTISEGWSANEANWTNAISVYNADVGSPGTVFAGDLFNEFVNNLNYDLAHINSKLENNAFKDSLNNNILVTDLVTKAYNYTEKINPSHDEFPSLTYDEFILSTELGGEIDIQNIAHPFAFVEITIEGDRRTARTRTYPIVNINDVDAILYYT